MQLRGLFHMALLVLALCAGAPARPQDAAPAPVMDAPGDFQLTLLLRQDIVDFTVDNLGNIYVLNRDNQLK